MRRIRQSKTQSVWRDSMNSKWWSLGRFCKKEKGVGANPQKMKKKRKKGWRGLDRAKPNLCGVTPWLAGQNRQDTLSLQSQSPKHQSEHFLSKKIHSSSSLSKSLKHSRKEERLHYRKCPKATQASLGISWHFEKFFWEVALPRKLGHPELMVDISRLIIIVVLIIIMMIKIRRYRD